VTVPIVTNPPTVLTPTVLGSVFNEPFTGASGAPGPLWGTSDKSTGSTLALSNNQLLMAGGTIGSNLDYQYLPSDWTVSNFNMRVDIYLGTTATQPHYIHVGFRGSGVQQSTSGLKGVQTTGYIAEIGAGEHYVKLVKLAPGVSTSLSQINLPVFVNNDIVHMRVIGNGTSLKVWAWRNNETEPIDPQINVADSSHASGKVYLGHTGGANQVSDEVRFDNMTIDGAVTTPPPPTTTTTKAHWGAGLTQDAHQKPASVNGTALAVFATVPNAMLTCHISSFSTFPPKLGPSTYDWDGSVGGGAGYGLDPNVERLRDMKHATAHMMITLALAPGWMKASGQTFEADPTAPSLAFEDDFAVMCGEVAARYPDVEYFQVWNEMKGMYLAPPANHWDYVRYTRLYNLCYNAIKAVRPDAKVGGPYVKFTSYYNGAPGPALGGPRCLFTGGEIDGRALDVMTYFKNNAVGYDFLCFDQWVGHENIGSSPSTPSLGAGVTIRQQLDKFIKSMQWVRTNIHATKPIMCVEFYPTIGSIDSSENNAGDYVIEVLTRTTAEVPMGDGIWYIQWLEEAEIPRPMNYSTGAELSFVTPKLRAYEAAT
jgi:hypothetical protein